MNRRIRNRTYGGVRGAKIINLFSLYSIFKNKSLNWMMLVEKRRKTGRSLFKCFLFIQLM
ncbi:hypothetical protein QY97_03527 [Bacillus thermotolerans]|nr:hypothetical protein QY97_03527 [Bacillus thermotolerans]